MNEAINFCCEHVQDHPCLYYRLVQETFHIRNTNISTIISLEFLIDNVSALEQVHLNVSFLLEHVCFSSFCCQVFWEGSVFEWQALLHYREGTTNRPHVWHHYYIIIWYPPTLLCSLGSSVMQCSPLRLRWLLRYLFTPLMCLLIKHLSKAAYSTHTHTHTPQQQELFSSQAVQSWATTTRREMLQHAENCFQLALGVEGTKHAEPWLYCLMLGKTRYKLGQSAANTLQHLLKVIIVYCDIL